MNMKTMGKRFLSVLCLALAVAAVLGGCGKPATSGDLMAGVRPATQQRALRDTDPGCPAAATGFGLELLRGSLRNEPGRNTLLSPLSVLDALAMAANGAQGNTLTQMETAFGMELAPLREFLAAYGSTLPNGDKASFHQANSLWLKEGALKVEPDFLQQNADYFGAGVFERPFDESTLGEINSWVNQNTHEMIPSILEGIPERAVMFLINALAFEGQWQEPYDEYSLREWTFTREDGSTSTIQMMESAESLYMQDDRAQGFLKCYAGQKVAFAALVPNGDITLREYLDGLTGGHLRELLTGAQEQKVCAGLPAFKAEYSTSLAEILQDLGVRDAFDPDLADFSAMGEPASGPLYIGDVLHKTYVEVDAQGTRAAAATAVIMKAGGGADTTPWVYLDRPFLYMIVDMETRLPIFLGALYDPQ